MSIFLETQINVCLCGGCATSALCILCTSVDHSTARQISQITMHKDERGVTFYQPWPPFSNCLTYNGFMYAGNKTNK